MEIGKRTAAIGAALALAAVGGGVAYAAASGGDQRDALLRDAAQRLDVSPQELRSALEGAFSDQLDAAVRAGRLTQEQADQIERQVQRHGLPLGGPLDGPHHDVHMVGGPGLDAAAGYLGLTRAQLARRLTSGRSLADVARAEGKSVDGLKRALLDDAKTHLDRAVADGALTAEQRDRILEDLREHVGELVTGTGPRPGPGFHRERHGRGIGFGGPGPGGPPPMGFPGRP